MAHLPSAPFLEHIGIQHKGVEAGVATTEVELAPHHMNRLGVAHGGVISTLLDTAMVGAARAVGAPGCGIATIEMKTSFMRAGRGMLRCSARCVHHSSTLAFCEAEVRSADGKLVAGASGTYRYLPGAMAVRVSGTPAA
jgi:uncharacterized protein (TIGR00369 family)